ncbi:MAG: glycosyltransferase [Chloroflexi bacterium]|nr:glycosyltransferase [Chloroflexota bacterium]
MTANRPMKIALLSIHSCPVGQLGARDTGGMNVYVRELASELGRQGHLVDVYTRIHDPHDPQIVSLGPNARLIHLKAGENEAIHKLAVYSYLPDFACNLENFRKQNSLNYDFIFSHYWLSAWVGEYLQQWWRVPNIAMFHTLGAMKNTTGIGEDEPELRLQAEKDLTRNCFHIIASTNKEREELIRHYGTSPERISVIPCGVNLELFYPRNKAAARQQLGLTDNKIILFVGRIEPLKGIEQLLRAIPLLSDTPRARLVIIGGDANSQPEIERLQKLARELQVPDSVDFLGTVKHEKLPYFYSAADVCVVPSYYESFGLVALESLACGTPVVTTDVGSIKSIIHHGESGYVIADNSPASLADKIALVLSKSEHPIPLIRASVSRFAWPRIAEAVVGECQLALAEYRTPALA